MPARPPAFIPCESVDVDELRIEELVGGNGRDALLGSAGRAIRPMRVHVAAPGHAASFGELEMTIKLR